MGVKISSTPYIWVLSISLLRTGHKQVLGWYDPAVTGETSSFMQKTIMELLACFALVQLPTNAIELVTERFDDPGGTDSRELTRRMAATQLLRSACTLEAFVSLLNFGYTHEGRTLLNSTNAVSEVAIYLARTSDFDIVKILTDKLQSTIEDHPRLAAASSLEEISARIPSLVAPWVKMLTDLALNEELDQFERGTILNCLGNLSEWEIPKQLEKLLPGLVKQEEPWISSGSLYILANHGIMENYSNLLENSLGLRKEGDQYFRNDKEPSADWWVYILGLLFSQKPNVYSPAVVSIIKTCGWQDVKQLIPWLSKTHLEDESISEQICDALFARILHKQSPIYTETDILELLAKIAPNTLAGKKWAQEKLGEWMPDAQVALANALAKVHVNDTNIKGTCTNTLEILGTNGVFAVRRAAFRALGKISQTYLYRLCEVWLNISSLDFNLRAAEACGWLVDEVDERIGFINIFSKVLTHPERSVRETGTQACEDRTSRSWANQYFEIVSKVQEGSDQEILNAWCYGDALSQIGDDVILSDLHQLISNSHLAPNVRFWQRRIYKNLEKNWKKRTQKWPDPWIDLGGMIENGRGILKTGTNEINIQYSLSFHPAAAPSEKHSWGGIISNGPILYQNDLDQVIIVLEDGREGEILVSQVMHGTVSFLGTGYYPSRS